MSQVTIEALEFSADARGLVFEPVGAEVLPAQRNVHVVLTQPGCVRGNHFHRQGTEIAVVLGPALVRLREDGVVRDVPVAEGKACRLHLPPGVSHAFKNTGTAPTLLVCFNTSVFDRQHPDVMRDVLIE
jgi:UDP-2-acetamido-2,6-beta-L-arabino-hexul-4-ose reductase